MTALMRKDAELESRDVDLQHSAERGRRARAEAGGETASVGC